MDKGRGCEGSLSHPHKCSKLSIIKKMLSLGVLPTRQHTATKLGLQVLPGGSFLLLEALGLVQQQGLLSWSKQKLQSLLPPQGEAGQGDANSLKQEQGGLISSPGPELPHRARPSPGHKPGSQQLQSACFKSHLTPH